MQGAFGLLAFALIAGAAVAGTVAARIRVRRKWEQTGGLDPEKDVRRNLILFAAIVVPALILMIVQLLLR